MSDQIMDESDYIANAIHAAICTEAVDGCDGACDRAAAAVRAASPSCPRHGVISGICHECELDAQDDRVMTDEMAELDLMAAIARIEESRASHQAWAEHMVDCAHCAKHGPPPYIQTRGEHEQIVREYDGVLTILRSVVRPQGSAS